MEVFSVGDQHANRDIRVSVCRSRFSSRTSTPASFLNCTRVRTHNDHSFCRDLLTNACTRSCSNTWTKHAYVDKDFHLGMNYLGSVDCRTGILDGLDLTQNYIL